MTKAVVLFSGGQDSTTCLAWAKKRYDVHALSFMYGQRHAIEIGCAVSICSEWKIPIHIISIPNISFLSDSAILDQKIPIEQKGTLPNTFLPGRNMMFFSLAGMLAVRLGARKIVGGMCQADFSGYPDCRNDFIVSCEWTLNHAMGTFDNPEKEIHIECPLMFMPKAKIFMLAEKLGVLKTVIASTMTCYNGVGKIFEWGVGCGECPACVLRKNGWEEYERATKKSGHSLLREDL